MTKLFSFLVVFAALMLPSAQAKAGPLYPIFPDERILERIIAQEWERRYNSVQNYAWCNNYYNRRRYPQCRNNNWAHARRRNVYRRAARGIYQVPRRGWRPQGRRLGVEFGNTRPTNRGRR